MGGTIKSGIFFLSILLTSAWTSIAGGLFGEKTPDSVGLVLIGGFLVLCLVSSERSVFGLLVLFVYSTSDNAKLNPWN